MVLACALVQAGAGVALVAVWGGTEIFSWKIVFTETYPEFKQFMFIISLTYICYPECHLKKNEYKYQIKLVVSNSRQILNL